MAFIENMDFLEKNLEQIIFETPSDRLSERGLDFRDDRGKMLRQVDLLPYGIADLIEYKVERKIDKSYPKHIRQFKYEVMVNVIELKKDSIGIDSLLQLHRYKTAVKRILDNFNIDNSIEYKINGILIGKNFEKNDFILLYNFLNNDYIYTYSYEFDGILFKSISKEWSNQDEHLLIKSNEYLSDLNNLSILKQSAMERIHNISEPILSDF